MTKTTDITAAAMTAKNTSLPLNQNLYKINDAAAITGFSSYALRKACKEGTIPYVWFGSAMLINVPAMMKQLEEESLAVIASPRPDTDGDHAAANNEKREEESL